MKIFLSLVVVLVLGVVAYHANEEYKVQTANRVCEKALLAIAEPYAQRSPRFVKLDVRAALSQVLGDEDFVIRAQARVVTLQNAAPNLSAPDYSIACRVKDGALEDAIWLRRP